MTINELIERAHAQVKAKGFWDTERNTGELLMLIVSECGEALEAHRKGRRADLNLFGAEGGEQAKAFLGGFKERFEIHIKDTFEDELADIVIRIADLCGSLQQNDVAKMFQIIHRTTANAQRTFSGDEDTSKWTVMDMAVVDCPENVGEALLGVCEAVVHAASKWASYPLNNLTIAIARTVAIAKAHNIDLWRHIELKLAYNETRPHLHGKQY